MAVVTFDLWHTLIQLSPTAEDRYVENQEITIAEVLCDSPRETRSARGGPVDPMEAVHLAFSAAVARGGKGTPFASLVRDAAERAGRKVDPELGVRAIEALVDVQPFEEVRGAREQLRRLKDQGFGTAVVSNITGETARSMRKVMERLEMAQYIDSWAFSDELPWAKPSPEIFWRALEPLATLPSDAVHIGDMSGDVLGARAAGFRGAILFVGARTYGPKYAALCHTGAAIDPPPEHVLSQWNELPALLDSLFAPR